MVQQDLMPQPPLTPAEQAGAKSEIPDAEQENDDNFFFTLSEPQKLHFVSFSKEPTDCNKENSFLQFRHLYSYMGIWKLL